MIIRKATESDFPQMLPIFRQVIEGGDTYDFEETASDQDAFDYWFGKGVTSFVAEDDDGSVSGTSGKVLGFYKIIPNHRGRGSHVANASFMVNKSFRHPNVSRETQPRFPSKNGLAHFYLETEGCRPMAKPKAQHGEAFETKQMEHSCSDLVGRKSAQSLSPNIRGKGIGRKMGEDCIRQARAMGFRAIQFNFVISTNEPAMHLWKSLGFKELCRLPGAFHHKTLGYVDAVIFFMEL
ncbi:MAG: GNAT family N-acetyltransferase [Fibrobacter sp.]|uniref:GNAT family N-acetyltransferase n=1 Tax=Fibrobacter sp. UWP2 TaxID=1896216 RepID=UPI00091F95E6|nr:GNAT family N-acetyltransferase [Fibrobacter sp. UWP2]MBO7383282.1 GNAT family N-acetyltransferase [Fibrobacter sp.]SHI89192.1 Acetyltransferase (GNAT) family protein [Fibrobacter sp. UWP2]